MDRKPQHRCLVCARHLDVDPATTPQTVHGGLTLRATPNPGSSLLDLDLAEQGERVEYLEYLICDNCVECKFKFVVIRISERNLTWDGSPNFGRD
jgi:hypothetical protein